ncbi:hypothetical protein IEQ34_005008 [Dendrobium chrysotoxum]|uniref:Uncharacterized protein n=1 Tax=Dendrobium chrysotoxum TaxID=161865 RepID=A0AAV7H9X6_DENCH|nr:hypothetical protein IEQ34_005008 [Dendrobium chrysotoxum]
MLPFFPPFPNQNQVQGGNDPSPNQRAGINRTILPVRCLHRIKKSNKVGFYLDDSFELFTISEALKRRPIQPIRLQ